MNLESIITSLPWPNLGWATIIVFIIVLILRGELVTRKVHEDMVNLWKDAYDKQLQRGELLENSVDKLTEGMEAVVKVVEALPAPRKEAGEDV